MSRGRAEEFKLQAKCVQWLWNEYSETRKCFITVDNNSDNQISALQKRALGMVKGAADTFFYWNKQLYFIEFKTPVGKQSDSQKAFELVANKHSSGYFIIRTFESFQALILDIIDID